MTTRPTTASQEVQKRFDDAVRAGGKQLDLAGLHLSELPDWEAWPSDLGGLAHLDLSYNLLTTLPECLRNLRQLESIDLEGNGLASLPDWLESLSGLVTLYVGRNNLTDLPRWRPGVFDRLTDVDLSGNQLSELPPWMAELPNVLALYLRDNRLTSLPEWLGNFGRLNSLDVSGNDLGALPEWLGRLKGLARLSVGRTGLSELPRSLQFRSLEYLDLSGNRLTQLPDWVGTLPVLRELDLSGNALSALPESLGTLAALSILDLSRNPLPQVPPEIQGAQAAVAFLLGVQADPVQLWTSKMLLVGQGRSGKTSLLKALQGLEHDPGELSTHGVHVAGLELAHPRREGVTMELSTWDFGGQDIYHATHQFFLSERSLFLLLWDAQVGWEESKLYYWLDMIKARAPHAPVVLVATHLGPRPPDLPLHLLHEAYPGMIARSVAVDSATGEGLDELRALITGLAADLPLMGIRWPRSWLDSAQSLRQRPDTHITSEELQRALDEHGIGDPVHRHALATALHSLGDILYYPGDEDLADMVVLRPQWLTGYLSKVLDDPEVRLNHGILTAEARRRIWHDLEPGLREHFVSMMDRFDLSYRTSEHSNVLVVELLPWQPPAYGDVWDEQPAGGERELRLRYRLHTVPPGIPTWFIAREHRFTTGLHWRTGVVLAHPDGEHRALLSVDRHARTAELTVRGPYPHDFFALLSDGFEETLGRYPGLEVTRLVPCPHHDQDGEHCAHEFPHQLLLQRLRRTPPLVRVECPVHLDPPLDVRQLLQGLEPPAPERSVELAQAALEAVQHLEHAVTQQHGDVVDQLRQVRAQQQSIATEQQRRFLALARMQRDAQEVVCPSVVSVLPARRRIGGVLPVKMLHLHLYCEAPGAWHRLPGVAPYEVRLSSEIRRTVLPYVQRVLTVLKYAVPVAGAAVGIASEDLAKHLKADIETMEALIEGLPDQLHEPQHLVAPSVRVVRAETDAAFRRMQDLLTHLDPKRSWAGLSKVSTPEGHVYWLCPAHATQYRGLPGDAVSPTA
ncbi:COR domain-containing protein [Streptacidiphilus rugosus]|uniref:COR domain-containing protein n=1 Tax=Streptacidiphilus rugosus TaxID=405783 RepID=UPI00068930AA|nr:COR domain-containing protein [Streptacidiphilus rugosus]